jgi:endonuclease I
VASRLIYFVTVVFLCATAGAAGYYDSAAGLTSTNLRSALHAIIRNHTVIPYSSSSFDTSDALKVLDEDPSNKKNVVLLYARRSEPKSNFGAPAGWNREHMWPNSYGIDDRHPAYSDLHNLRAEDIDVNSARGNKYYDRSNTNATFYAFPAHVEAQTCSTDYDSWEPPAPVKGDIARAMFYMDVRYEGDTGTEPDLKLTEGFGLIAATNDFMGRLITLLAWHELDPVDDAERQRNEKVFQLYQHNRNPFVDQPEWVREIFWPRLQMSLVAVFSDGSVHLSFTSPREFGDARLQTSYGFPLVWVDLGAGIELEDAYHYEVRGSSPSQYFRLRPIPNPLP